MLYKNRIENQNKRKDFYSGIRLNISLSWMIFKNKFNKYKTFDRVLMKNIHDALESGQKELRYYQHEDYPYYESIEALYKEFCLDTGRNMEYDPKFFTQMYELVHQELYGYKKTHDKDIKNDLTIGCHIGKVDLETYFYIILED